MHSSDSSSPLSGDLGVVNAECPGILLYPAISIKPKVRVKNRNYQKMHSGDSSSPLPGDLGVINAECPGILFIPGNFYQTKAPGKKTETTKRCIRANLQVPFQGI